MFAVVTKIKVEEGSIDELARLFAETNPALVEGHDDWLGALFTANRDRSEVTVIARWSNASSYETLRSSSEFQNIMSKFAEKFVSPPDVSINEVLIEM